MSEEERIAFFEEVKGKKISLHYWAEDPNFSYFVPKTYTGRGRIRGTTYAWGRIFPDETWNISAGFNGEWNWYEEPTYCQCSIETICRDGCVCGSHIKEIV